jgi:hypothetical protein
LSAISRPFREWRTTFSGNDMKRNSSTPKAPGQRQLRVAERIRHLLAQVLREASFDWRTIACEGPARRPSASH